MQFLLHIFDFNDALCNIVEYDYFISFHSVFELVCNL